MSGISLWPPAVKEIKKSNCLAPFLFKLFKFLVYFFFIRLFFCLWSKELTDLAVYFGSNSAA